VGWNPARGMDVCICFCVALSCVGRGLCDGLITRPKVSYQVSKYITKPPDCRATDDNDNDDDGDDD
jgi:hypothetical protein